jgi:lipopolysaccharide biosynthesis glycosyltransferase
MDGDAGKIGRLVTDWAGCWSNLSLRFVDAGQLLREREAKSLHLSRNISAAAYYRLFAPELFEAYRKIIYLDVDLVLLSDVARLYHVELGDKLLAGCHDVSLEELAGTDPGYAEYCVKTLGIESGCGYFNSGVLVLNLEGIRKSIPGAFMRRLAEVKKPRFHDQDILNSVCAGKVLFLPPEWNVPEWMADPAEESSLFRFGGQSLRDACRKARQGMQILHYTGTKPWSPSYFGCLGDYWWKYAAQTPFHRQMVEEARAGSDFSWLRRKYQHAWFQKWKACLFQMFCTGVRKRRWREKFHNAGVNLCRIRKRMEKAVGA